MDGGGGGGGGGGLYPRRLITGCVLCLQVNGPVTGGSYKWGEGGLYPGGAYYPM